MKGKVGLSILFVFILIQFIPIKKNQPDETNTFPVFEMKETMNAQVFEINNKIAHISWYLANHIGGGKKKLNFAE